MKVAKKIFLPFLLMISVAMACHGQGINFEENLSWGQILRKSKAMNIPIFIDFYTTWCIPCREMDAVYQDKEVGLFYNSNFISVKVQLDRTTKDNKNVRRWYSDAERLKKQYEVAVYPTFVFIEADGKVIKKIIGKRSTKQLIWEGQGVLNPNIVPLVQEKPPSFDSLVRQYKGGTLSISHMRQLATRAETIEPPTVENKALAKDVADRIINDLPEDSLYTRDNLWLLCTFTRKSSDRGFNIFKDHADKITEAKTDITEIYFKGIVPNILYNEEIRPWIRSLHGRPDWQRIKVNLRRYGKIGRRTFLLFRQRIIQASAVEPFKDTNSSVPNWNLINTNLSVYGTEGRAYYLTERIFYHTNKREWDSLYVYGNEFLKYVPKKLHGKLVGSSANNVAWALFNHRESPAYLKVALEFSKIAIAIDPLRAAFHDTYGNILYKLGLKKKALKYMSRIINLPTSDPDIKENYLKMKAGKKTWDPKNW